jgi:hypothetical protein
MAVRLEDPLKFPKGRGRVRQMLEYLEEADDVERIIGESRFRRGCQPHTIAQRFAGDPDGPGGGVQTIHVPALFSKILQEPPAPATIIQQFSLPGVFLELGQAPAIRRRILGRPAVIGGGIIFSEFFDAEPWMEKNKAAFHAADEGKTRARTGMPVRQIPQLQERPVCPAEVAGDAIHALILSST